MASIGGKVYALDYDLLTLTSTTSIVLDWAQTHDLVNNPDEFTEGNVFLGKSPTDRKINQYFLTCIAANYFVGDVLLKNKRDLRHLYYLNVTIMQVVRMAFNHRAGVRIQWKF